MHSRRGVYRALIVTGVCVCLCVCACVCVLCVCVCVRVCVCKGHAYFCVKGNWHVCMHRPASLYEPLQFHVLCVHQAPAVPCKNRHTSHTNTQKHTHTHAHTHTSHMCPVPVFTPCRKARPQGQQLGCFLSMQLCPGSALRPPPPVLRELPALTPEQHASHPVLLVLTHSLHAYEPAHFARHTRCRWHARGRVRRVPHTHCWQG